MAHALLRAASPLMGTQHYSQVHTAATPEGRETLGMTDTQIADYLRDNGYPEHLARAGRNGLIDRYRKFIEQVEHGYKLGLEDYRNDLDLRGILSMLQLEADPAIQDLDRRLDAQLTNRTIRVWETSPGDPPWDFGYPANAGPDLIEDLTKEGLI